MSLYSAKYDKEKRNVFRKAYHWYIDVRVIYSRHRFGELYKVAGKKQIPNYLRKTKTIALKLNEIVKSSSEPVCA